MILDITSFGWSGSGAYHDLLREYDDVEFPYKGDWEFDLLWAVDGIYDLEEKLCHKHCRIYDSDMAISRFLNLVQKYNDNDFLGYKNVFGKDVFYNLCKEYIEDLISIKIDGRCFLDIVHPNKKEFFVNIYNGIIKKILCNRISKTFGLRKLCDKMMIYNSHLMRVSYNPDNFLEKTQNLLNKLFRIMRKNPEKTLVMDQMFPPDIPTMFRKYVQEDHKLIIVRRDPRDTYLAMQKMSSFPYPIPRNAKDFIWFYKKIVMNSIVDSSPDILSIHFEDLIYEYEQTVKKLECFLGLKKHVRPYSNFNPEISKNNTQLFSLYPEYSSDIKLIEKELTNYLYPFDRYSFQRSSNTIF